MRDYFLTLASYHRWAYGKLFESLKPLDDRDYRRDVGLPFGGIHGTLNHLLLVERLWLARFENRTAPYKTLAEEIDPDRLSLVADLEAQAARWTDVLVGWPGERFAAQLSYVTTEGDSRTLPVTPLFAHVFNHGTHHRGQISAIITRFGYDYPVMDLPYFLAEAEPVL